MRRLFVSGLALAVLATGALHAATTGKLSGKVADASGAALPGVTITATSPSQIGGARVEVTNAEGAFTFPSLTPGQYNVTAALDGFVGQERTNVQVRLDRTTEMAIILPQSSVSEEIMVTAEAPVVDPQQVGTSQTFTEEYLQNVAIGSANRSYQSVLTQVGGVTEQAGAGGNPSVYGSTLGENAFLIDGVDTTDPVTSTFGTNFNFDAIQEISFLTGGFDAEYGRASGGVVNIVTKSGGNSFSGTVDVRYTGDSYTESGDHFDPDEQTNESLIPGFTLGGPILQDKLWFFIADEFNQADLHEAFESATESFEGNYYLGKLTWQINPSWQAVLKTSGDPAEIDNDNIIPGVAPEAATFQEQGGTITQGEVNAVFGNNLLWDVKASVNRQELNAFNQTRDFDAIPHQDLGTGQLTGASGNSQFSERDRDELKTSLTYFVSGAGTHELKAGLEASDMTFSSSNFNPAGIFYYDYAAVTGPYALALTDPVGITSESTGDLGSVYLQDAWQISTNFTAKLGVRYDQVSYENDAGSEVGDMDELQPRIGLAWDILGDATTVARVSAGRFMHPNALTLPNFARTTASPQSTYFSCQALGAFAGEDVTNQAECEAVGELFGFGGGFFNDPENADPVGWLLAGTSASNPSSIQEGLKPTYADELIISFERQLFDRSSITVTYVDKETKDLFEDTCIGNLTDGLDPEADCSSFQMGNLGDDVLTRDYQGAILTFESRAVDWLHILASYTYAKSRGSVEYTQNAGTDFDYYPAHFVNTYGYLSDDRRHRVKLNGYALMPWDFSAGFNAFWGSGIATDHIRTPSTFPDGVGGYGDEFLEPRGSHRGGDNYQLDLEIKKGFNLGPVRTELVATVFNVIGSERVTGLCERDSCVLNAGTPSQQEVGFLEPTAYQIPRNYEVGLRFEF